VICLKEIIILLKLNPGKPGYLCLLCVLFLMFYVSNITQVNMFLGARDAYKDLSLINSYKAIKVKNFIELLTPPVKRKIKDIQKLLPVTAEVYAAIFEPFIEQIIMYMQLLPQSHHQPLGSMLYTSLLRTKWILENWQIPKPVDDHDFWNIYVVFTAALLKDLDRIFQYYQINLLDDKGQFLRHWLPYSGAMLGQGSYYTLLPLYVTSKQFSPEIIALLARQIISSDVYKALAANKDLYFQWLALIKGESHPLGTFESVLSLLKNEELKRYLQKHVDEGGFNADYLDNFDLHYGIDFLDWLRKEISDGNLDINIADAGVHVVSNGIFIEPSVLVEYLRRLAVHSSFLKAWLQFVSAMGGYNIDPNKPATYMQQASFIDNSINSLANKKYSAAAGLLSDGIQHKEIKQQREGFVIPREIIPALKTAAVSQNLTIEKSVTQVIYFNNVSMTRKV
jgi:hypothetical protein